MTYNLLLPTDPTAQALAFDSEHEDLDHAIAAADGTPGAQIERAVLGGSEIVWRLPVGVVDVEPLTVEDAAPVRARHADGTFRADDPATPANEAFA